MANIHLRCRKCRGNLNEDSSECVISCHNESMNLNNIRTANGKCAELKADVFFIRDTAMPNWISASVNEADWCKGKLTCPHCNARLGSFDFVSGVKCACNNFTLPAIHLVRSKIDYNII